MRPIKSECLLERYVQGTDQQRDRTLAHKQRHGSVGKGSPAETTVRTGR